MYKRIHGYYWKTQLPAPAVGIETHRNPVIDHSLSAEANRWQRNLMLGAAVILHRHNHRFERRTQRNLTGFLFYLPNRFRRGSPIISGIDASRAGLTINF